MLLNIQDLLKFNRLAICILVLSLISCKQQQEEKLKVETGFALGTTYQIKYEGVNTDVVIKKEIENIIEKVNKSMSTYIPTSDISKINQGDSTIVIDAYFKEVFLKSKEVWKKTKGNFDPTVGSLVNAWGFGPEKQLNNITKEQIDSILNYVGLDKLTLTPQGKILKQHPEIFLDFNALAKGYTIDLIGRMFHKNGIENYLIELGGEILAKGKNPSTLKSWVVAIDDPRQDDSNPERPFIAALKLENKAMASSGNYRKFRIDQDSGERYVHTINPITGYTQKSNILATSVIASTCMEADAYATAFMAMDLEDTKNLLSKLPNIEAYILIAGNDDDIEIFTTEGFKKLLIN
ncbi:FAD:protein FMN transferase [Flavobacteriaceae bacterium R38]|nr:FAD:protein FMN transferase [Flavobacteriaceae bacterium R38]